MKRLCVCISLILLASVYWAATALAADGTVKATFKYKDTAGIETALAYGYIYLHDGSKEPPMERFFSAASYILGPSDAYGRITANVPEGTYFVRITRRGVLEGRTRPLGPPEEGDYTWSQTNTITVTAGQLTDLGTKYASFFGSAPITISGIVKNNLGAPVSGRYVRAQTEPCIPADGYSYRPSNHCGPVKYLAQERTDAEGKYTIQLKNGGTYYIYGSTCLGDRHQQYRGNPCIGTNGGIVTVNSGDRKTLDFVVY